MKSQEIFISDAEKTERQTVKRFANIPRQMDLSCFDYPNKHFTLNDIRLSKIFSESIMAINNSQTLRIIQLQHGLSAI